jgi:2-polyprenyl-3-methyl-5-hydroxy-6-metoxy-1,4-benzoquinol methylase
VSAPGRDGPRTLRTCRVPACPVCGASGTTLYEDLADHLFGAPGLWRMVRCGGSACGLLWLDPAPFPGDLELAYENYYTHVRSAERPFAVRALLRWVKEGHYAARFGYVVRGAAVKRLLALALRARPDLAEWLDDLILRLPPCPGGRVLDVGCGEGRTLEQLRDLGWQVEGVDFDSRALRSAEARGVPVRLGTLADQRYPDSSFDAVVHRHVLEHVPDPVALLAECRRVLRPDGRLVLLTPNAKSLGHARFGSDWRGLEPPRHLQVFTPEALRRAAEAAGLRVDTLETTAAGAAFIHAQSRLVRGEAGASPDDRAARRFEHEERRHLARHPWAGEELWLTATRD